MNKYSTIRIKVPEEIFNQVQASLRHFKEKGLEAKRYSKPTGFIVSFSFKRAYPSV